MELVAQSLCWNFQQTVTRLPPAFKGFLVFASNQEKTCLLSGSDENKTTVVGRLNRQHIRQSQPAPTPWQL